MNAINSSTIKKSKYTEVQKILNSRKVLANGAILENLTKYFFKKLSKQTHNQILFKYFHCLARIIK